MSGGRMIKLFLWRQKFIKISVSIIEGICVILKAGALFEGIGKNVDQHAYYYDATIIVHQHAY